MGSTNYRLQSTMKTDVISMNVSAHLLPKDSLGRSYKIVDHTVNKKTLIAPG